MGAVVFTPATTDGTGRFPAQYIDNKRAVRGNITMSASYATGGDTLALTNLDIKEVTGMFIIPNALSMSGLSYALGGTKIAPTIIAVDTNGTEVTAATNLSARAAVTVLLLGA